MKAIPHKNKKHKHVVTMKIKNPRPATSHIWYIPWNKVRDLFGSYVGRETFPQIRSQIWDQIRGPICGRVLEAFYENQSGE